MNLVLDSKKTTRIDFKNIDSTIYTILVRKDGDARIVIDETFDNIVTDSKQETEYVIIILKSDKNCIFYDVFLVRYFRRRR